MIMFHVVVLEVATFIRRSELASKRILNEPPRQTSLRDHEVKEKFSIPEDLAVTDDTGTEVDKDVFPDLMTTRPSTPQSSVSLDTDTLSLTSKSSEEDSDWFSPKRFRKDDNEASQSLQARDLIKEILHTRPGGANVLKEYEDTGTISDDMRKLMVNILVAHMIETEGRVPHRLTKQNYGLGIITLFPSLRDPQGRTGYILQDFTLLFGSESASRLKVANCLQSKGYQASRNLDFHSTAEKITVICQREKGGTGFPRMGQ
ncbi:unnamed protein product [Leuciscus chuanchicus]